MTYTLTMRDDADGSVCVVPADDLEATEDGVLVCAAEAAVAVVDRVAHRGGVWRPHPTLQVSGRSVAVPACDISAAIVTAATDDAPPTTEVPATGRGLVPAV